MLSYEKIIVLSQAFATSHEQINEFGNGDLWEVVENNKLQDFTYPLLWLQDNGSSIQGKEILFNFNVLAIDQVLDGEENENFVKSSMHQILLDYLAYFDRTFFDDVTGERIKFVIQRTANGSSFTERFNDVLTGWTLSVSFKVPFSYDKCNVPGIGAGTGNAKPIFWELDFYETDDISYIPASAFNVGTFTSVLSSSNVGDITISTDNISYSAFTLPFTPTAGNTYFFKRSEATVTGQYILSGTYE